MKGTKFKVGDRIVYAKYESWHHGEKPVYIVTQIGELGQVYAKVIGDNRTTRGAMIPVYAYELEATNDTPSQIQ